MTIQELQYLLTEISCEVAGVKWEVTCGYMGEGYFVQLRYVEKDIVTGNPEDQHGRKWYVSAHSCKSEVVQTVLKACLTSAEHMIREHFRYRGATIFGPHFDVDVLAEGIEKGTLQVD